MGFTSFTIFLLSIFLMKKLVSSAAGLTTSIGRPYTLESGRTLLLVLGLELRTRLYMACIGIPTGLQPSSTSVVFNEYHLLIAFRLLYCRITQDYPFFHKRRYILRQSDPLEHQRTMCVAFRCVRAWGSLVGSAPKGIHNSEPTDRPVDTSFCATYRA